MDALSETEIVATSQAVCVLRTDVWSGAITVLKTEPSVNVIRYFNDAEYTRFMSTLSPQPP